MLGQLAALIVRLYQVTLGRLGPGCGRFYPSCSEYAVEAFRTNGLVKGGFQATWRLLRCGPWSDGGYDPVTPIGPSPLRALTNVFTRRAAHTHG